MTYCLSLSVAIFIAGAAQGLAAIWVVLGFMPVVVPAVDRHRSIYLWVLLSTHIVVSVIQMVQARRIAIAGWLSVRPAKSARPKDIQFIDAWFMGSGLLLFLTALAVPFVIAAIVMINPWMSIVALAAIGAAVKGMTGWSNVNQLIGSLALKRAYWPWPKGALLGLILAGGWGWLATITAPALEEGLGTAIQAQEAALGRLEAEGERLVALAPRLGQLYELKVSAEQAIEALEAQAAAKGASSGAVVNAAKVKVLDASIALMQSASQLSASIATNRKEAEEIRQRIVSLRSAAPSLHK